ncbi:MAG: FAD:protein FMN transferase ApbE [Methylococcus sp.]|nr:MAG: FAD:protein FMN transferase ApbE [Methylococcus sp.]
MILAVNPAVLLRVFNRGTGSFLLLVLVLSGCSEKEHAGFPFQLAGTTMGTTFSVKISVLPDGLDTDELKQDIRQTFHDINSMMSTYLPDSELSRFNRHTGTDWVAISKPFGVVLAEAVSVSELSSGAYDVTVGPLVNLWGFGPGKKLPEIPSAADIQTQVQRTGFRMVELDEPGQRARKTNPALYIDLSSLAKGYAVDRVTELLVNRGIDDYLVEVGGEIKLGGSRANGEIWNIAVEKPEAGVRSIEQVLQLTDVAVATSGDYRNFFESGGLRYSHTIDPRTGWPVNHALVSVTVLDASAMHADALATALMVLGPDEGFQLASKHQLTVLFIKKRGEGFETLKTAGFPAGNG